jgi:hypothetical protein
MSIEGEFEVRTPCGSIKGCYSVVMGWLKGNQYFGIPSSVWKRTILTYRTFDAVRNSYVWK